jgi:hypothetical protein
LCSAPYPEEYGGTPPKGGMDAFHAIIFNDELGRAGCGGLQAALFRLVNESHPGCRLVVSKRFVFIVLELDYHQYWHMEQKS